MSQGSGRRAWHYWSGEGVGGGASNEEQEYGEETLGREEAEGKACVHSFFCLGCLRQQVQLKLAGNLTQSEDLDPKALRVEG